MSFIQREYYNLPQKNSLKIVKLFFTKRKNSEICIHVQLEHQTSNIFFIYESLKGEFSQKSHYDCHKCNFTLFIVIQIKKNAILILFNYLIISYFKIKLYIYFFKLILLCKNILYCKYTLQQKLRATQYFLTII
jgi:hypothetical protein